MGSEDREILKTSIEVAQSWRHNVGGLVPIVWMWSISDSIGSLGQAGDKASCLSLCSLVLQRICSRGQMVDKAGLSVLLFSFVAAC